MMKKLWTEFKQRSLRRKLFDIALLLFAGAGAAIIGAWLFFELGGTRQRGGVDKNYRYLMSVSEIESMRDAKRDPVEVDAHWMKQYVRLAALSRFYPVNARLITQAAQHSNNPYMVDRMIAAAEMYIDKPEAYQKFCRELTTAYERQPQQKTPNVIPWMNTQEWEWLRESVLKDSALINEAGRLSGVEPRMIAGCLIGEQIRLFNSKREVVKKYLGPVKALSVQSQFSFGVNGVKLFTAQAVERHLKDASSPFYMGKHYENLLNFESNNHENERYKRLVDYRNHLYSYLYTGCILHQIMLQWRRAGYDISDRPDILFTLFNIGFDQSQPKPDPVCGGSHIKVDGRVYTFGAIGFDFYYSGELSEAFPYWEQRFIDDDGKLMTEEQVSKIQDNVSDCRRPSRTDDTTKGVSNSDSSFGQLPATPAINL